MKIGMLINDQILKYKGEFMGIAIIMIMIFHSCYRPCNEVIRFIMDMGDMGVDLFMLLSGFSLAYGLSKNADITRYYKRRYIRILPAYFIVYSLYYAYTMHRDGYGVGGYFYNIFFLNYFVDEDLIIWFIPVILVYYTIFPYYYYLAKRVDGCRYIPLVLIIILSVLLICDISLPCRLVWYRLPAFLLGANLIIYNPKISNDKIVNILLALASLIGVGVCYYTMRVNLPLLKIKYFAYLPMFMLMIRNYRRFQVSGVILTFLGSITLEIYLLHERLQSVIGGIIIDKFLTFFVSIIIALIVAYSLHQLITKLLKSK